MKLYFIKFNLLFKKALKNRKITKFDNEIYEKMNDTIIACLPVSFYIRYSNYLFPDHTCYERSLYMFLAIDNAILVRGKKKTLEYNYGKGQEGHGWVEIGNYVYDPSLMLKFDKDTYYSLYGCSDISKIDRENYMRSHKDFVDNYVSHNLDEFRSNGVRRLDLGLMIFQLKTLSELLGDEQFTEDLNNYLDLVEYDEDQISEERHEIMKKILVNSKKANL